MDDKQALQRLRKGNTEALEELMDRYAGYVCRIVSQILLPSMTEEDVEEVISDVFLTLWRNCRQIQDPERLKSWLGSTARNRALNKLRERRAALELEEDLLSPEEESMDARLSRQERQQRVQQALSRMGEPDREIFLRHYCRFQPVKEIAAALGLSLSAVKTRLLRGRRKLRDQLLKGGVTDETDL